MKMESESGKLTYKMLSDFVSKLPNIEEEYNEWRKENRDPAGIASSLEAVRAHRKKRDEVIVKAVYDGE